MNHFLGGTNVMNEKMSEEFLSLHRSLIPFGSGRRRRRQSNQQDNCVCLIFK